MKRILVICISVVLFAKNIGAYAQDESSGKFSLSLDLASGFVWRGQSLNTSPVIQPEIAFNFGNLSVGTWASTPFVTDDYKELDLFINYQITPFFSIGITDYFVYANDPYTYFDFKKNKTGHNFDLQLMYEGQNGFKALASTIILSGEDFNAKGDSNFSTYIELGYGNTHYGVDWEICAGFVPMASIEFYEIDKANVVNLGFGVSKKFEITPTYSLPLSLQFTVNPAHKAALLTVVMKLF